MPQPETAFLNNLAAVIDLLNRFEPAWQSPELSWQFVKRIIEGTEAELEALSKHKPLADIEAQKARLLLRKLWLTKRYHFEQPAA